MIWRPRPLKRSHVAAGAIGRQALPVKLSYRAYAVAGVTVSYRMCADQRKSVLMLIDGVDGNLPPVDPVTNVALRAVFPAMNVGVAVLALTANIGENRIHVTFLTRHLHVHTAQGVTGLAVVKLRIAANRSPRCCRVAPLASNVQRAMRVLS